MTKQEFKELMETNSAFDVFTNYKHLLTDEQKFITLTKMSHLELLRLVEAAHSCGSSFFSKEVKEALFKNAIKKKY